jgi:peptidoglycan/LPS O-acetylase OafA/YrhL
MKRWQPAPSSGFRIFGIEGLRAVAACSIVVYHCWQYASPDGRWVDLGPFTKVFHQLPLGVTLFFALSGFLLYRPFAAAILRAEQRPLVRAYVRNRALRILPGYWAMLVFAALVLGSVEIRTSKFELSIGSFLHRPGLFFGNALLVQDYSPRTTLTGIGQSWSLAVEVVFYLFLPLLVMVAAAIAARGSNRRARRIAALVPSLIVLLIGLSGKAVGALVVRGAGQGYGWLGDWHSVIERSFWLQADLFTFGMALAVLSVEVEDRLVRLPSWWRPAAGAGVLVIAVPTAIAWELGKLPQYPYDSLMALACTLVLALVVLPTWRGRLPPLTRLLETRPLGTLGVISYSLFLVHGPLIYWLRDQGLTWSGRAGFPANLAVVGAVSVVLAALSYQFVERPALARKARPLSPAEPADGTTYAQSVSAP